MRNKKLIFASLMLVLINIAFLVGIINTLRQVPPIETCRQVVVDDIRNGLLYQARLDGMLRPDYLQELTTVPAGKGGK